MRQCTLSGEWQLKQRDSTRDIHDDCTSDDGWIPARVPGTVHEALLAAGRIPDPFYGLNERDAQWVGEQDWLYRCAFGVDPSFLEAGPITLCCDGLDTVATVWLNGERVLNADNMFVPWRVDVDALLRPGRNLLAIVFESALRVGQAREAEWGVRAVWNGDASRVYLRKAQYHYGWDWGPCLLTAGPWRPVRLEAASARIVDVDCPVEVAGDLGSATLSIHATVEVDQAADGDGALGLRLRLIDPRGAVVDQVEAPVEGTREAAHRFVVPDPELWWPNGYGAQPLYRLETTLVRGDTALDRREQRVGLRRLRLLQEPVAGEPGTSFAFEINGLPIFCGGANWIPADSFTTRLTPRDYRTQLAQAAAANMVMLRVWGGGIYEDDAFYDGCDELGLLVWQDFMFACGLYPAHASFQQSVRAEAEAQVRRLRHHPCLALWCGNNEDYSIAQSLGVYDAGFDDDFGETRFPARAIYERLLPEVCARLDPTRPYWPGSPYGGGDTNDQTVGDRHTWDVWHGAMAPYQDYPRYEARFVSEFGMEAAPTRATIEAVTPPHERYPQSRTMDHHNKSTDGPRRLAAYIDDTLRVRDTLDDYIYATQFVQSEALGAAYRGWRRRWRGPGRYAVAGALVWQLNDCWPVTSWAIVDFARRPKPAYYTIRRELAPLAIGLARAPEGAAVWAVNATRDTVEGDLVVRGYGADGAELFAQERRVTLDPNRATELGAIDYGLTRDAPLVVAARLVARGEVVARATLWVEPFKYVTMPDPEIALKRDGDRVQLHVTRPAKGVWLAAGDGVEWSDNMLDLLPRDPQTVTARGLGDQLLHIRSLWPSYINSVCLTD